MACATNCPWLDAQNVSKLSRGHLHVITGNYHGQGLFVQSMMSLASCLWLRLSPRPDPKTAPEAQNRLAAWYSMAY